MLFYDIRLMKQQVLDHFHARPDLQSGRLRIATTRPGFKRYLILPQLQSGEPVVSFNNYLIQLVQSYIVRIKYFTVVLPAILLVLLPNEN